MERLYSKRLHRNIWGIVLSLCRASQQTEASYCPQKLLPQLQKYTRMNKASLLNPSGNSSPVSPSFPLAWSPSAIRKMTLEMNARRVNINMCYLGERQMIGKSCWWKYAKPTLIIICMENGVARAQMINAKRCPELSRWWWLSPSSGAFIVWSLDGLSVQYTSCDIWK